MATIPTCRNCGGNDFTLLTMCVELVRFYGSTIATAIDDGREPDPIDYQSIGAEALTYGGSLTAYCRECGHEISWGQRADFNAYIEDMAFNVVGQQGSLENIDDAVVEWLEYVKDHRHGEL